MGVCEFAPISLAIFAVYTMQINFTRVVSVVFIILMALFGDCKTIFRHKTPSLKTTILRAAYERAIEAMPNANLR